LRELPELRPDVVLMDINLPGMSGIDCVRRLKARLPDVQVLMVTVYDDGDRVFKALLAGANGYLLKASIAEDIVPAVRDVMRGGAPLNSFIARKVVQFFRQRPPEPKDDAGLTAREVEVLELLAQGTHLQGNRGPPGHLDRYGAATLPPHLRQDACGLPHRGGGAVPRGLSAAFITQTCDRRGAGRGGNLRPALNGGTPRAWPFVPQPP
jgi:CheY-like chemotaxis protein